MSPHCGGPANIEQTYLNYLYVDILNLTDANDFLFLSCLLYVKIEEYLHCVMFLFIFIGNYWILSRTHYIFGRKKSSFYVELKRNRSVVLWFDQVNQRICQSRPKMTNVEQFRTKCYLTWYHKININVKSRYHRDIVIVRPCIHKMFPCGVCPCASVTRSDDGGRNSTTTQHTTIPPLLS